MQNPSETKQTNRVWLLAMTCFSDDSFLQCHRLVQSQDLHILVPRMTWQCNNHSELCGLTVISTLNRDLQGCNTQWPCSRSYAVVPSLLSAYNMHSRISSKALIICNRRQRQGWASELRYAYAALCHLFSVTVSKIISYLSHQIPFYIPHVSRKRACRNRKVSGIQYHLINFEASDSEGWYR